MDAASLLEDAVEGALARYEIESEEALRRRFRAGTMTHVVVRDGRRIDAGLLAHLVLEDAGALHARRAPSAEDRLALLKAAGLSVVSVDQWSVEDELRWRLDAWRTIRSAGDVTPRWLNDRGIYRAKQGIWVDRARTHHLAPEGAAVAVLHTGRHYADDLQAAQILYHYPKTYRPPARDANEVAAVKNSDALGLPLFVITQPTRDTREVQLAWVVASDDSAGAFLMEFADSRPVRKEYAPPAEEAPFQLMTARGRRPSLREVAVRDPEFKFRVLRRYEGACAITGVAVKDVLDAAHVVPVDRGGTDDERNGLLLTATLHRALDAHLWALEPSTLLVVTRPHGPTLSDLRVTATSLRADARVPRAEALEWRFREFRKRFREPQPENLEELGLLPA